MTASSTMDMSENTAPETLAVRHRRACRREEFIEQSRLAELLTEYLDPSSAWFTGIENKPHSALGGMLQRRRGCRSGLPDMLILFRRGGGTIVIFIEMKSIRGRVSRAQKQMRADVLPTGVRWYMARSAVAALTALWREGVPFRKAWTPPALEPWAGPFPDPTLRLPLHPLVTAERREEKRRYRLRRQAREREAAQRAAERDDGDDIAA
jgi:hypothetical protein